MASSRYLGLIGVGLTIVVATATILWLQGGGETEGIRSFAEDQEASSSIHPSTVLSGEAPLGSPDGEPLAPQRREVGPRTGTRVLSTTGQPIEVGVAVWEPRRTSRSFWRDRLLALEIDHAGQLRTPIHDGGFVFDDDLGLATTSALIVLAPDHLASAREIAAGDKFPETITLQPTGPVIVQVSGPDGIPVANALVRSIGSIRVDSSAENQAISEEYVTDADGRATIYPLPGESLLIAESDKATSEIWVGDHERVEGLVLLELVPSFSVVGTVEGFIRGANLSGYWVTVALEEESWQSVSLTTLTVQQNGSFAGRVPWKGDLPYVFRLYGRDSRPFEVREQVSEADAVAQITFNLREGHEATFLILDVDGNTQADIPVAAVWSEDGNWLRYPASSDEHGLVSFHDCPPQQMWVWTLSKHYSDKIYGPYMVSVETTVVLEIILKPAGRIEGQVLLDGEPAKEFQVVVWPEDPFDRTPYEFNSPDGRFEITDAPLGLVNLAAFTDSHPMGPVEQVTTTAEGVVTVELQLNEAIVGSGRVLDIATGRGIPGASVQVWTKFESKIMDAWGPPVTTDVDGRFHELHLSPGGNALGITADGFEREVQFLSRTEETVILLGDIGLAKTQDLLVRLLGRADTDFNDYTVVISQGGNRPPVPVDAKGEVLIEAVDSGICGVHVWTPDGERIVVNVDLISGREWEVEIPVSTERTVIVNVEPEPGEPLPDDLWIEASYLGPGEHTSSRVSPVEADGRSTFHCVAGDGAVFRAVDERGVYYASLWVTLGDTPLEEVTLQLTGKSSRLLLLDADDKPVTGVFGFVMAPGDPLHDQFSIRSDSAGIVTLLDFGSDVITLMVDTGQGTFAVTPPIHLDVDEDPIRVHLDSTSSISVRLEESGSPVESVRADLAAPGVFASFRTATSDKEGLVRFQGLSETRYILRVEGYGWWPSQYDVNASPDPPIQTVPVRRIGSLITRITRLGLPLPKAELRLTSLLDNLDISTWIESGLITTGPSVLLSDLEGEVSVQGIPAGPYRWTVIVPGLAPLQGQIEVRPLDETILPVSVE